MREYSSSSEGKLRCPEEKAGMQAGAGGDRHPDGSGLVLWLKGKARCSQPGEVYPEAET